MPRGAFSTNGRSEFSKRRSSSPLTKFEVFLSKTAVRQLERFPRDTASRIRAKLRLLADDPRRPRPGTDIRILWGHEDPPLYRLPVGGYRVLYFVVSNQVRVTEILHPGQAHTGDDSY